MSLKRLAMLAALSYHNQQHYNNNNNNNTIQAIIQPTITTEITTTAAAATTSSSSAIPLTTTATTLSIPATTITKINSNKSTLIQLKQQQSQQQQQQHQQLDIVYTTTSTLSTPQTTFTTTTKQTLNTNNTTIYNDHSSGRVVGGVTRSVARGVSGGNNNDIDVDSVDSDSFESSETNLNDFVGSSSSSSSGGHQHQPSPQQSQNTYTSTTYYGSGFGVFHQQNIRSNGGGIALITGSSGSNGLGSTSYSNGINNNVNLLLGGAMLTLITTILCVVCYCCHRNIKKRTEAAYRQQHQWLENDPNMEIYSVEQCYETSGLFVGDSMDGLATIPALHHEPPPSYDAVVAMQEQQQLLMQQQQQQLMMQQQQHLMQQLPNNSPPPGYRSSLDVSTVIQQTRGAGTLGIAGYSSPGIDTNSLTSLNSNVRATSSRSSRDPLGNYNDSNGNMMMMMAGTTSSAAVEAGGVATTSPLNHLPQLNFLRNKQQQQQRNLLPAQLTQLNMKKVLQAQSCCSLQRAEVENMWNAAAAALAARSANHNANDTTRATTTTTNTTASTSSPTLVMNPRKLSTGQGITKALSSPSPPAPETFGSRYLKQNYYRRGCPLCGKFRNDDSSPLSISMESNLDNLLEKSGDDYVDDVEDNGRSKNPVDEDANVLEISFNNNNEAGNINEENDDDDDDEEDGPELECSCIRSNRKQQHQTANGKSGKSSPEQYQQLSIQPDNDDNLNSNVPSSSSLSSTSLPKRMENLNLCEDSTSDSNANNLNYEERQSENSIPVTDRPSNNNNNNLLTEVTSSSSPITLTSVISATAESSSPSTNTTITTTIPTTSTTPSVTIDLDCINENGIISLDMSKIIDKTGLPTYDAALKLESSGYV